MTLKLQFEAYQHTFEAKVNPLCELQSQTQEELRPLFGRALLPSVLDKAFKGEL